MLKGLVEPWNHLCAYTMTYCFGGSPLGFLYIVLNTSLSNHWTGESPPNCMIDSGDTLFIVRGNTTNK